MQTSSKSYRRRGLMAALSCGALVLGMALAAPAALAASDDQPHGSASGGAGGAAAGADGTNGSAGKDVNRTDLTTCMPGQVWDANKHKCLQRHSGVLPDSELTGYANALLKADQFEEAIDVLDLLDNPNTPRALNYRGYATRRLGTHRRRDQLLSSLGGARSCLPAGARISWRSLCDRGQVRSRQGAAGDDREDLRQGLLNSTASSKRRSRRRARSEPKQSRRRGAGAPARERRENARARAPRTWTKVVRSFAAPAPT